MIEQKDIEQYCRTHELTSSEWCDVSQRYKLSEEFVREYRHQLAWYYMCRYQKFSINFMREFPRSLWPDVVVKYQDVTTEFIEWMLKVTEPDPNELEHIEKAARAKGFDWEQILEDCKKVKWVYDASR